MSERTCIHAACSCRIAPDEEACSPSCAEAAAREREVAEADACECGHPECRARAGSSARGGERG